MTNFEAITQSPEVFAKWILKNQFFDMSEEYCTIRDCGNDCAHEKKCIIFWLNKEAEL